MNSKYANCSMIDRLIGLFNGTSTQKGQFAICANCGGGRLAQAAKNGQRDSMHNTLRYTITM